MANKDNNEFVSLGIKLVNGHILVDDVQGLVVDTGSPQSFHESGRIEFEKFCADVATSLPGVLCDYLSKKIGVDVHGVLGMDIIGRHWTQISLKDNLMFINDDAPNGFQLRSLQLPMNMLGMIITINGWDARMVVDTAAPVSYINQRYVRELECVDRVTDFSPYCGDFETEVYECETDLGVGVYDSKYTQRYGTPPPIVALMLERLNVDGIIGVDIFNKFRLQIRNGVLYVPPQGI